MQKTVSSSMTLRQTYNRYISFPLLDRTIKSGLRGATALAARLKGFHFPRNYVRQQKWEMLTGAYEQDSVALFKHSIRPGMVVVDLGAHIGYFTRLFSKLVGKKGKVLACEADPFIFKLLQKNTEQLQNVEPHQLAISDEAGTIDFYHSEEKSGCGSTVAVLPVFFKRNRLAVSAAPLDSVLEEAGISRVDFIKMDIEGGEPKALRGMRETLKQNPAIILVTEFAPEWIRAGGMEPLRFLEELRGFGFSLSLILDGSLVPFDPKTEEEMRTAMPSYFANIYCKRVRE